MQCNLTLTQILFERLAQNFYRSCIVDEVGLITTPRGIGERSIVIHMSVCLSATISQTPRVQILPNFQRVLPVAVARLAALRYDIHCRWQYATAACCARDTPVAWYVLPTPTVTWYRQSN